MGSYSQFLVLLLGLAASVTASVLKREEYHSTDELLGLDLHSALETPAFSELWSTFDEEFDKDFYLSEEDLIDMINDLMNPALGSKLKIERIERAFDIHANETGTLKSNNVTGNYTSRLYRDFHLDTDNHTGHYNGVMYKEGQMPNSSVHYVIYITEGHIKGMGYTTEWKERGWTHVFQRNQDHSLTQIANTTQGSFGQINSTADGQFTFATHYLGANNMSNHFFHWANRRHGSLNSGPGGFNWTATGEGQIKAVNGTTKLGSGLLVGLLMNIADSTAVVLEETGGTANFTDSSAGVLQVVTGVSPYNTTYSETLMVSSNKTYNTTETASGFMWRTQESKKEEPYAMHLIDVIKILK